MINKKIMSKQEDSLRINEQIRSTTVRLVGENVTVDVYPIHIALSIAKELELDLIEINPNAEPPICKIQDYNKFLYERKKKLKEMEKKNKQNQAELKELRFGPNTDEHDFNFKMTHAMNFLKRGDKVKATVSFKGREIVYKDKGEILLLKFADGLSEIGLVETFPKMEGYKMFMVIRPKK